MSNENEPLKGMNNDYYNQSPIYNGGTPAYSPSPAGYSEQSKPLKQKETWVAYLLWFFLYWTGAHRFYVGNIKRAIFWIVLIIAEAIAYFALVVNVFSLLPEGATSETLTDEAIMLILQNNSAYIMPYILMWFGLASLIFVMWVVDAFTLAGSVRKRNAELVTESRY